jgi:prolyl-tRNA synthetase
MVLADSGEDAILSCSCCDYAANVEKAESRPFPEAAGELLAKEAVSTPDRKTIEEVASFLGITPDQTVKALIVVADGEPVMALVRGDHDLNELKLKNYLGASDLEMASDEVYVKASGGPVGFAGPCGVEVRVIADQAIAGMRNFVIGGNSKDLHFRNANVGKDFDVSAFADIRTVVAGDACPRCSGGTMEVWRGIEVGHVFKLGTKYSEKLKATYLDADGKEQVIFMGCYGIGVGRSVAACIEQNHDDNGIIFPIPIAPFHCIVSALSVKEEPVVTASEDIYNRLAAAGIEVLLDDRDERPGFKFKDADLIGIPLRIVVGAKNLADGKVELKHRKSGEVELLPVDEAVARVRKLVAEALS